jgi:hypothetical protein
MSYQGDFRLGDTIYFKFTTTAASTGAPTTLSGSPVLSAYPNNSTTELTAGITLTADFDSRTGLNQVAIVASGGNGYATNTNYDVVITTGTVGGTSAVGYVVGSFSIEARSALMPTTAARTLDVASTGEAGLDFNNVNLPVGGVPVAGILDNGTLQSATSTTAVIRAAASFADSRLNGGIIAITGGTGVGQARLITGYNNTSKTVTVDTWTTTPDNTSTYIIFYGAPASNTALPNVNTVQISGTPQTARDIGASVLLSAGTGTGQLDFTSGVVKANLVQSAGNAVPAGAIPNAVAGAAGGLFIAGTNAATTVTGSLTTTFTGNLTGNVGGNVTGSIGSLGTTAKTDVSTAVLTTQMTESYAADGTAPTLAQAVFLTMQGVMDYKVVGTTLTINKLDGTTVAATCTLNDATSPTSRTRAT